MKKKDSWNSDFRKNRFYENQKLKRQKENIAKYGEDVFKRFFRNRDYETSLFAKTKQIAIMLDLEGTSEKINEENAKIFIKQLEFIRKKFEADIGTISISTHCHDSVKMQSVLDILGASVTDKIKIGLCFYYGGIYDFDNKMNELQEFGFNVNKLSTFSCFYLQDFLIENTWFAIIDDNISEDVYKQYQKMQPMLVIRPSKHESDLVYNNFMNIATKTKDFDGVIESLDIYINSIKNLNREQILEKQKNMMYHLSSWELMNKIKEHDFAFLEKYFNEGYADETDYQDTLMWIGFSNIEEYYTEELARIKNILDMIKNNYEREENSLILEKVKEVAQRLQSK